MVKLIANRAMRYGTRSLTAGDVFDARPKDARVLTLLRRAERYVEPEVAIEKEEVVDVKVVTDEKPKAVRRKAKAD